MPLQYNQNEPVVAFSFNKEGSDLFAKMTSENVGSRFAIVLDGGLITAPVIREANNRREWTNFRKFHK